MHFHWSKMEDIINHGGGNLVIGLYNSKPDDSMDSTAVHFKTDGMQRTVEAGGKVILKPGESITLEQGMYHRYYGEGGKGKVLVGEVSGVNDDASDNCFLEEIGRFPVIEEDEEPIHLLVGLLATFRANRKYSCTLSKMVQSGKTGRRIMACAREKRRIHR